MNKLIALLASAVFMISACDNQKADETTVTETETQISNEEPTVVHADNLWEDIAGEPDNFNEKFAKLSDVEKYYFCAAFSMGAMSVSKPATASAMVNYFLGLGVVKHGEGINETTYKAFDFGKNIFRYELVVTDILEKKTCENIIIEATEHANNQKISTEELNDKGKVEVEKIVDFIKK